MTTELAERQNLTDLPRGHGRGPGGQPTGLKLPAGRCPVPGCGEQIDRTRLMCRRDWYHIPKRLRDQAWRTWRSGQEAHSQQHQKAVLLAIAAARVAALRARTATTQVSQASPLPLDVRSLPQSPVKPRRRPYSGRAQNSEFLAPTNGPGRCAAWRVGDLLRFATRSR